MGLGLSNPTHLLFVGVVLLLLFGAKRLPEMGRSLGAGIRDFKGALTGDQTEPVAQLAPAVEHSAVAAVAAPTATPVATEPTAAHTVQV